MSATCAADCNRRCCTCTGFLCHSKESSWNHHHCARLSCRLAGKAAFRLELAEQAHKAYAKAAELNGDAAPPWQGLAELAEFEDDSELAIEANEHLVRPDFEHERVAAHSGNQRPDEVFEVHLMCYLCATSKGSIFITSLFPLQVEIFGRSPETQGRHLDCQAKLLAFYVKAQHFTSAAAVAQALLQHHEAGTPQHIYYLCRALDAQVLYHFDNMLASASHSCHMHGLTGQLLCNSHSSSLWTPRYIINTITRTQGELLPEGETAYAQNLASIVARTPPLALYVQFHDAHLQRLLAIQASLQPGCSLIPSSPPPARLHHRHIGHKILSGVIHPDLRQLGC